MDAENVHHALGAGEEIAKTLRNTSSPSEALAILIAAIAFVLERVDDDTSLEMAGIVRRFGDEYRTNPRFDK